MTEADASEQLLACLSKSGLACSSSHSVHPNCRRPGQRQTDPRHLGRAVGQGRAEIAVLNSGDVLSKSLSQAKDPDHLIKLETFYPIFAIAAQAAAVRSDFPTHSALYHRVSKISKPRGATLVHFGDDYDLQSDPEIMSLARKSEVHPTGARNLFSTRLRHLGCTGGSCRTDGLTRKRLRLC